MKQAVILALAISAMVAGRASGEEPAWHSGVEMTGIHGSRTVAVKSLGALQQAIDAARPGDRIVLAHGTYASDGAVTVNCAGAEGSPIVIAAETVGAAEIQGKAGITFGEKAQWVVVEGFVFTHAMAPMHMPAGTKHLRLTRNDFALANDKVKGERPDVEVSGDECEVDHNTFRDKATEGPMVTVQGPGKDGMAQRTWIHHNLFSNFMPTENNCSAIQIGLSWRSMTAAHALTEYNLFVKCRGENEGAICNKSCENVYRYNTFAEGTRELSLRHGNGCAVYGNYFLNTDGLRFFGHDHRIYGNYFEGCKPAIHVGNGDATIPPGKLQMHDEPVGEVVASNVLVNNRENIVMARRNGAYGAERVTIENNVIVGGPKAADIQGPLKGATWEGNVVWKTEAGDIPAGGFVMADPGLVKDADGVWRVGAGSALAEKMRKEGATPEGRVLTEKDVGPGAK